MIDIGLIFIFYLVILISILFETVVSLVSNYVSEGLKRELRAQTSIYCKVYNKNEED